MFWQLFLRPHEKLFLCAHEVRTLKHDTLTTEVCSKFSLWGKAGALGRTWLHVSCDGKTKSRGGNHTDPKNPSQQPVGHYSDHSPSSEQFYKYPSCSHSRGRHCEVKRVSGHIYLLQIEALVSFCKHKPKNWQFSHIFIRFMVFTF